MPETDQYDLAETLYDFDQALTKLEHLLAEKPLDNF